MHKCSNSPPPIYDINVDKPLLLAKLQINILMHNRNILKIEFLLSICTLDNDSNRGDGLSLESHNHYESPKVQHTQALTKFL